MTHKIKIIFAVLGLGIILILLAWFSLSGPQHKKHQIVFEVNTASQDQWPAILTNIENVQKAFGPENVEIEVVAYSKALKLLVAKDNALYERLKKLADTGIVFAACENSMKQLKIRREDLVSFAITVDEGLVEVIRKQEQGWVYIKTGY